VQFSNVHIAPENACFTASATGLNPLPVVHNAAILMCNGCTIEPTLTVGRVGCGISCRGSLVADYTSARSAACSFMIVAHASMLKILGMSGTSSRRFQYPHLRPPLPTFRGSPRVMAHAVLVVAVSELAITAETDGCVHQAIRRCRPRVIRSSSSPTPDKRSY